MSYHSVRSFRLTRERYLFFDIFRKGPLIILVCPAYSPQFTDFGSIRIRDPIGRREYARTLSLIRVENEPFAVLAFRGVDPQARRAPVTVLYKGARAHFLLPKEPATTKKLLVQTTLMKSDYRLIRMFYPYYRAQGVEHFYMYYNGRITPEIAKEFAKPGVTLIPWNFPYWNRLPWVKWEPSHEGTSLTGTPLRHHAQMGQMHHALYKYGKGQADYMIFNDLDEYMHIKGLTLRERVADKKYTTYIFHNRWAKTLDGKIPHTFPRKFHCGGRGDHPWQSKCIHKTDVTMSIYIHSYRDRTDGSNAPSEEQEHFHFHNWGSKHRIPAHLVPEDRRQWTHGDTIVELDKLAAGGKES